MQSLKWPTFFFFEKHTSVLWCPGSYDYLYKMRDVTKFEYVLGSTQSTIYGECMPCTEKRFSQSYSSILC